MKGGKMPSHAASAHLLHGSMPGRAALDRTAFVSLKSWMARSLEEWEPLDMGEERRRAPWDAWRQRRAFLGGSTRPFQVTMRLSMWARRNAAAAASAAPRRRCCCRWTDSNPVFDTFVYDSYDCSRTVQIGYNDRSLMPRES